jgi:hypothetical protein
MSEISCAKCGAAIKASDEECPLCGCTFSAGETKILLRASVRHGQPGQIKPYAVYESGDSLHRESGEWRRVERTIDRKGNRYLERVMRPDGEIVREVDELLTEHTGRGSARGFTPNGSEAGDASGGDC